MRAVRFGSLRVSPCVVSLSNQAKEGRISERCWRMATSCSARSCFTVSVKRCGKTKSGATNQTKAPVGLLKLLFIKGKSCLFISKNE